MSRSGRPGTWRPHGCLSGPACPASAATLRANGPAPWLDWLHGATGGDDRDGRWAGTWPVAGQAAEAAFRSVLRGSRDFPAGERPRAVPARVGADAEVAGRCRRPGAGLAHLFDPGLFPHRLPRALEGPGDRAAPPGLLRSAERGDRVPDAVRADHPQPAGKPGLPAVAAGQRAGGPADRRHRRQPQDLRDRLRPGRRGPWRAAREAAGLRGRADADRRPQWRPADQGGAAEGHAAVDRGRAPGGHGRARAPGPPPRTDRAGTGAGLGDQDRTRAKRAGPAERAADQRARARRTGRRAGDREASHRRRQRGRARGADRQGRGADRRPAGDARPAEPARHHAGDQPGRRDRPACRPRSAAWKAPCRGRSAPARSWPGIVSTCSCRSPRWSR